VRINIVGSGVVGGATGRGLLRHGHDVLFVDANPVRVRELANEGLNASLAGDADPAEADITILSVNTPTVGRRVDTSNLLGAVRTLGLGLRRTTHEHTVVVRSTVPPGTTLGPVREILEQTSARIVGDGLGLAMNPEFLRQVSADQDFLNPWLTVFGAAHELPRRVLTSLYEPFGADIVVTDPTTAEVIKYAHNLYNATKISYFNEFYMMCEHLGIDSDPVGEVVARSAEGMWRPQYGIRGGRPYDGACLPKDTVGFLSFANDLGIEMPLLSATVAVNEEMERRVAAVGLNGMRDSILSFPSEAATEPSLRPEMTEQTA
jgi:UDPglucose 6-dehydrogenase